MQKDPLLRLVDAKSMRLQLTRRRPLQIADHVLWKEAEARLQDRLSYIRVEDGPRLDHGIGQYGLAMNPAPGSLEMIWSVGLLAYLSDLRSTLGFWAQALRPGGLLMFVTLGPDSFRRLALALGDPEQVRHVAGYPDMHDIGDALVSLKMANPVMDAEWLELHYTTAESALQDIRQLSGNPLLGRPKGLNTRAWRGRVLDSLESLRRDGTISLQVELIFGHAWAGRPRKASQVSETQPVRWLDRPPKGPAGDL